MSDKSDYDIRHTNDPKPSWMTKEIMVSDADWQIAEQRRLNEIQTIEADDYVVTVIEFQEDCKTLSFTDYDGYGYLSDGKTYIAADCIVPSNLGWFVDKKYIKNKKFNKKKLTHVVWFNK